ncbi:potassium channel family protein [uncultured Endozoicomonas sp.]|uniref:potassium channel family protein n=1 Tax=uncultured Endozoicomonas sp. TaxID=432652 RepID=UPI00262F14F3|nr:potassium channel family protein [uncultured Endozoicomonas sp.]
MLRKPLTHFQETVQHPHHSLGFLLLTLIFSIVFSPLMIDYQSIAGTVFSALMIASMVLSLQALTEKSPRLRRWLKVTGIAIVVLRLLAEHSISPPWLPLFTLIASMLFNLGMMVMLMGHLFSKQPEMEKLLAAINFYLLTGVTFSYLYLMTNLFSPGSFDMPAQSISSWPDYLYFSFVTLTTLGYGDILPLSSLAQSLASLEAVIGVLSPTVMIARFVGK